MRDLFWNIFSNILFIYKNFFHFNLSKIIIFLVTILYIIAFFIPLLIVFATIFYFLGMFDWGFNPYLFLGNPYYMWFWLLFFFLGFLLYVIWYSYSQVLLTRLNLSYADREKLSISKNYYLDKKIFWAYLKLSLLLVLIFLLPIIIWVLWFIVLIIISWWITESLQIVNSGISNNITLGLLILTVLSIILFIYLSYKTAFSYIILVNNYYKKWEIKTPSYYIKKSFKFTKWFKIFLKFVLVLLTLLIITFPIYFFEDYYSTKAQEIKSYINLDTFYKAWWDLEKNTLDYEALRVDYWDKSLEELSYDLKKYSNLSMLFYILEFLFVWGLFNMVLVSFYRVEKK